MTIVFGIVVKSLWYNFRILVKLDFIKVMYYFVALAVSQVQIKCWCMAQYMNYYLLIGLPKINL